MSSIHALKWLCTAAVVPVITENLSTTQWGCFVRENALASASLIQGWHSLTQSCSSELKFEFNPCIEMTLHCSSCASHYRVLEHNSMSMFCTAECTWHWLLWYKDDTPWQNHVHQNSKLNSIHALKWLCTAVVVPVITDVYLSTTHGGWCGLQHVLVGISFSKVRMRHFTRSIFSEKLKYALNWCCSSCNSHYIILDHNSLIMLWLPNKVGESDTPVQSWESLTEQILSSCKFVLRIWIEVTSTGSMNHCTAAFYYATWYNGV